MQIENKYVVLQWLEHVSRAHTHTHAQTYTHARAHLEHRVAVKTTKPLHRPGLAGWLTYITAIRRHILVVYGEHCTPWCLFIISPVPRLSAAFFVVVFKRPRFSINPQWANTCCGRRLDEMMCVLSGWPVSLWCDVVVFLSYSLTLGLVWHRRPLGSYTFYLETPLPQCLRKYTHSAHKHTHTHCFYCRFSRRRGAHVCASI